MTIDDENCDKFRNEEIQKFIDKNTLEDSEFCPVISEVKWCLEKPPRAVPKTRDKWLSSPEHNSAIRERWYSDRTWFGSYVVENGYIDSKTIDSVDSGRKILNSSSGTQKTERREGDIISAIEAVNNTYNGLDIRLA